MPSKKVTRSASREPLEVEQVQKPARNNLLDLHETFCMHAHSFKANTPQTIRWYKQTLGTLLKFDNLTDVRQMTKGVLEQWILYGRTHRKWSAKTANGYMDAISLFLDWCAKNGHISENPMKQIERPKIPFKVPKHLTLQQAELLLDWTKAMRWSFANERARAIAIIATFIYTGIRKTELMNLKMFDVNLETGNILVKAGKGDKDRVIKINPRLHGYLSNYLQDREKMNRNTPYFFVSLFEDRKMSESTLKRLFDKLSKKSGIHVHPHLLRHTFAVLMLEGEADIYAVSKMLGHSRLQTTEIYLSATTKMLESQINKHPLN